MENIKNDKIKSSSKRGCFFSKTALTLGAIIVAISTYTSYLSGYINVYSFFNSSEPEKEVIVQAPEEFINTVREEEKRKQRKRDSIEKLKQDSLNRSFERKHKRNVQELLITSKKLKRLDSISRINDSLLSKNNEIRDSLMKSNDSIRNAYNRTLNFLKGKPRNITNIDCYNGSGLITKQGINSININMSLKEYHEKSSCYESEEYNTESIYAVGTNFPKGKIWVTSKDSTKSISSITTESQFYRTKTGLHVGITVEEYLRLYPKTDKIYYDGIDGLHLKPEDLQDLLQGLIFKAEIDLIDEDDLLSKVKIYDYKGDDYILLKDLESTKINEAYISVIRIFQPQSE